MPARIRHVAIAQPKQRPSKIPNPERWNGDVLGLKGIGRGISGMVFIFNPKTVVKVGFGSDESTRDMETERRAYSILQEVKLQSPHILRCLELDNPRGLMLELCHETVRQRLRSIPKEAFPSDSDARRWAKQAAEGLAFLHERDIIHADVGCHNMLLSLDNVLKICDFGGSSIGGSPASTKYEVWSRLPSGGGKKPTKTSDLFALGSSIYEMSTKEVPYRGMPSAELQHLYEHDQFPPLRKIASLGNVIMNCWLQNYACASDIVREIDPQHLLCCGDEEILAKSTLPLHAKGMILHRVREGLATTSPPTSEASEPLIRSSTSTSSASRSMSSSNKELASSRRGSFEKCPINSTSRYNHGFNQSIDHKTKRETSFHSSSSNNDRNKRKSSGKKTINQSTISRWMKKSVLV